MLYCNKTNICVITLKNRMTFNMCICILRSATFRGAVPTLCTRPRIDHDLSLTPSKPFHNMQLAMWLIPSQSEQLKCQHGASLQGSLHMSTNHTNYNTNGEVCARVCGVFMIRGVYVLKLVLKSEWCKKATAGWCPALLPFQLRF